MKWREGDLSHNPPPPFGTPVCVLINNTTIINYQHCNSHRTIRQLPTHSQLLAINMDFLMINPWRINSAYGLFRTFWQTIYFGVILFACFLDVRLLVVLWTCIILRYFAQFRKLSVTFWNTSAQVWDSNIILRWLNLLSIFNFYSLLGQHSL